MIQMPPNFRVFTNSSNAPTQTTNNNFDNTNNLISNQTTISNSPLNINSEETVYDLLSLDNSNNMSEPNTFASFDEVFDIMKPNYPNSYQAHGHSVDIKEEPSFNDDTQSSFSYADSPQPITERVVNRKNGKEQVFVKYGPIKVRPRQKPAPTLNTGRKSKNVQLPPDEERRREERRRRNREAAEKCKQNREVVVHTLEKNYADLVNEQKALLNEQDNLLKEKQNLIELLNEQESTNNVNNNNVYNTAFNSYTMNNYPYSNGSQYPHYSYQSQYQYSSMNHQHPSTSNQTQAYNQIQQQSSYNNYNQWN